MNKTKRTLAFVWSLATAAGIASSAIPAAAETWIDSSALSDTGTAEPAKDSVLPDANQFKYQKDELAAFCHFGPNTFNEIEWGEHYGDQAPSAIFRLNNDFDAETYVRTIRDAGFKKLIVTAKHHDGFCIWDSAWTQYDCAAAGYKDGKGDVLAELSEACTKYNIDMGLYLSPWDIHDSSYGYYDANGNALCGGNGLPLNGKTWAEVEELDVKDYNEYYNNQLEEILGNDKYGNNGHFVEVWMDGAKGSGASTQNYDFSRWFETIQSNEGIAAGFDADCMLFGAESYTTVRWIGNENGTAADETWSKSTIDRENNTINSNTSGGHTKGFENGNQWTVPEADARITSGWFWGNNKKTPKSIKDLAHMYFSSIGHGGVWLLNIPPNSQGTLDDAIKNRTLELGETIRDSFRNNILAESGTMIAADSVRGNDTAYSPDNLSDGDDLSVWSTDDGTRQGTIHITLPSVRTFDCVSIEEAIQYGQRINSWSVRYKDAAGSWKTLQSGTTIGPKRLIRTDLFKTSELEITVSTPEGKTPVLSEIGLYRLADSFANPRPVPTGAEVYDILDSSAFTFTGSWTNETGTQYLNGTNTYANPGASVSVQFTGSMISLIGTLDPNHGTADVYIDDQLVETIDMNRDPRQTNAIIFTSPTLSSGAHTLRLVTKTKATGIEAAMVVNNDGKGMVGIEQSSYTMNEDETMNIKLIRQGGSEPVSVTLSPNPGTAIQDDFNTELIHQVDFAAGETEKTVTVQTRRNTNKTGSQFFTVELSCSDPDVILGFNDSARINIIDFEGDQYSQDDPYVFPNAMDSSTTLEAARGIPHDEKLDSDGQWSMGIYEASWAENGKIINCFNQQDTLTIPYHADKAGTYTATVYYRSGSTTNKLVWAETNDRIETGEASAGASDASVTQQVSFDITVNKPGSGTLVFTGPDGKSPMLDRFVITPKTLLPTLTVTTGEHGQSNYPDPVGVQADTPVTIEFTPDDGYALSSVTINGEAAQLNGNTVIIDSITEDTTVAAQFAFDHYTTASPFVFPDESQVVTLEAEHFVLNNTGENEKWPLQKKEADWASNGLFVNSCNNGDSISLSYTAMPGVYEVTLSYRSGSESNGFAIAEADGKIDAVDHVAAGADSANTTHTKTFDLHITQEGFGTLTLSAATANAPQMDKFEIKVKPDSSILDEAIAQANTAVSSDAWTDYTSASRTALETALAAARELKASPTTMAALKEAKTALEAAIAGLTVISEYELTVECGPHGTADPSGTTKVSSDTPVTITFTPEDGYVLDTVKVNGSAQTVTGNTLTLDSLLAATAVEATFAFDHYTVGNPFVFPADGASGTLEAEHSILNNTGSNEQWPLQKSSSSWASNGKFINACNLNDSIDIPYMAAQPGDYTVVLTYRSGDSANSIDISEPEGKVESISVTAGASDGAGATHTKEFTLRITEAGAGILHIAAGSRKAPQMDKFEITAPITQPVPELDKSLLILLTDTVEAHLNDAWIDGSSLPEALSAAKLTLETASTQTQIDDAVSQLHPIWLAVRLTPDTDDLDTLPVVQ